MARGFAHSLCLGACRSSFCQSHTVSHCHILPGHFPPRSGGTHKERSNITDSKMCAYRDNCQRKKKKLDITNVSGEENGGVMGVMASRYLFHPAKKPSIPCPIKPQRIIFTQFLYRLNNLFFAGLMYCLKFLNLFHLVNCKLVIQNP